MFPSLSLHVYASKITCDTKLALIRKDYPTHSYCVHFLCFWYHRYRRIRYSGINRAHRTGGRAYRLPLCCLLDMVKRDIRHLFHLPCDFSSTVPSVSFCLLDNITVLCCVSSSWMTISESSDRCSHHLKCIPGS